MTKDDIILPQMPEGDDPQTWMRALFGMCQQLFIKVHGIEQGLDSASEAHAELEAIKAQHQDAQLEFVQIKQQVKIMWAAGVFLSTLAGSTMWYVIVNLPSPLP